MSKKITSVTSLHNKRNIILSSNEKSRNTSQETTHIISGKSNNTLLQWTTSTNVKVSKRTTGNYSTGGLFTTETVISSNSMYAFINIHDETVIDALYIICQNISQCRETKKLAMLVLWLQQILLKNVSRHFFYKIFFPLKINFKMFVICN